jgi:probable O-glycosylation ligase (exosortase A-associated)
MRDVIVSLLLIGLLPVCFRKPFVGLLLFSLLAYMRVQDLTWGFARDQRWSFYVAIVMFAGFFANRRDRKFMSNDVRNAIMILMVVLVAISLLAAGGGIQPMDVTMFTEYVKIVTIALFTTGIVQSRERLRLMIWTIALSFGFFGAKSGLAGILTAGQLHILEGPGGMLQDNNDFALALGMGIPLMWHIAYSERNPVVRRLFFVLVPLTIITVALTHSRGGFLALSAGLLVLVWRSRNRVAGVVVAGFLVVAGVLLAPATLSDRLSTIKEYEEDASAAARLRAWETAFVMIKDNPMLGVGYARFQQNYMRYSPHHREDPGHEGRAHVAHNSYLQIWAECGTPTFLLYLSLILISFWDLTRTRRMALRRYHASWILHYAAMFEASMVVFLVGSMFLNRAQFDLLYHMVALIAAFGYIARREMEDRLRYPERAGARGTLSVLRPAGFARLPALGGNF